MRYVGDHPLAIEGRPCLLQRLLIDIGPIDEDFWRNDTFIEKFEKTDRQRIHLFAGRAAGHPDTDRVVRPLVPHQLGIDVCFQRLVLFRFAKERSHSDQQILVESFELERPGLQRLGVAGQTGKSSEENTTQDTSLNAGLFVLTEIGLVLLPHHLQDAFQCLGVFTNLRNDVCLSCRHVVLPRDAHELLRDFAWRQDEIGRGRRRSRHDPKLRALGVLGKRDSAGIPDGLQASRAVGVVA